MQSPVNHRIKKWIEDVNRLNLRFPVAEIAEKTGFDKGNVSAYLNNKRSPSDNFLTTFYEKFGEQLGETVISVEGLTDRRIIALLLEANRNYSEGYKKLGIVLERMENEMARRDDQAKIKSSLEEVLAGVETIADRQGPAIQKILADLDELKRKRNDPS